MSKFDFIYAFDFEHYVFCFRLRDFVKICCSNFRLYAKSNKYSAYCSIVSKVNK